MVQSIREKAKIRQAREEGRPSEDDVAQERLGWRGQKGRPSTANSLPARSGAYRLRQAGSHSLITGGRADRLPAN